MQLSEANQKGIVKWMWRIAIAGILGVALLFVVLSFQDLPTFDMLENPQENVASEVYANDMSVLGRYYVENRVLVDYEDISPHLVKALIATEDERYFSHSGIDFRALLRVVVKSILLQKETSGGGSTISQQLAKLLFDRPDLGKNKLSRAYKLFVTKLKEWMTAVKLERSYTKEEIIAMYLNHVEYVYNSHGIQAATETYFAKNQKDLKIEEAAMLVGMLKNPSLYNPVRRPELVQQRRMVVLKQMQNKEFINEETYDSLKALPIDMSNFQKSSHNEGIAPYFRMEMRKELKRILARPENLKPDGTPYRIDLDGLKIYTTIDESIQRHAEAAMLKHMKQLQHRFFRHWNVIRENPWEYDEDDSDVDIKMRNLKAQIRNSERYQAMRARILVPAIKEITDQYDHMITDADMLRMIAAKKDKAELARLYTKKVISKKQRDLYQKILAGDNWSQLKSHWNDFQGQIDAAFDKKVEMRVFTYENNAFEKDTVMSPLDSIMYHRKHLQTGILAIEPQSGYIKAWVGGINLKRFQHDHIHSNRQVGSTFKPIVYSTAIAFQGISPCMKVYDVQHTISKGEGNFNIPEDWSPKNSDGEYDEIPITLYDGLKESKNTISVFLMKQIGDVDQVRNLASNFGISKDKLPPVPSICLGSADISLYEMTGAYAAFANDGIYIKPTFIKQIEDKNGQLIYRSVQQEERVLQRDANYVMVDMLRYALGGRGGAYELKSEVGGKTGTTQNHSDGWFMGITPTLVVGTWVGGEDRWIRFRDLANGQGSVMARPIFIDLIKRLENDKTADYDPSVKFPKPSGKLTISIDCEAYEKLNAQDQEDGFEIEEKPDFF